MCRESASKDKKCGTKDTFAPTDPIAGTDKLRHGCMHTTKSTKEAPKKWQEPKSPWHTALTATGFVEETNKIIYIGTA
jgi:hypothetical protein